MRKRSLTRSRIRQTEAPPKEPQTPEEWQQAVDVAAGARCIADCKMYGLIAGGPRIDIERADNLLARGREQGIEPSRPAHEIAIDLITQLNQQ